VVSLSFLLRFLKKWALWWPVQLTFAIAFSLGLGWLAIRDIQWALVKDQFNDFPVGYAILALAVFMAACVLRAYRWQKLFINQQISVRRLFLVQHIGLGLNNLVPVRLFSEVAQFALLRWRYNVSGPAAIATLSTERILDLVVTATILLAGLTLIPQKGDVLPYVVGAFIVAILSLVLVRAFVWASRRPLLMRIGVLVQVASSFVDLAKAPRALASSLLLTLAYWLGVGFSAWILAYGMDLDISAFEATVAILGSLYVATSLPALPAAVGTFEFGVVYVLKLFNVDAEQAFSFAVVMHAILFLPPIIIALVYLPVIGPGIFRPRSGVHNLQDVNDARKFPSYR
jgi:uncharacterized membrane protein YbhN (UPF0104 family)